MLDLKMRPASVTGASGPVTLEDLPSTSTTHWVARRKAEVVAAIDGGLLAADDACERYRLSHEELGAWRRMLERGGVPGLRITKSRQDRRR